MLTGQIALVTGGSRGIGRATALAFAAAGADIGFCHLDDDATAADTERDIRALGRRVLSARVDVADIAESRRFAALVEATLGPVDILFNNAGANIRKPFEAMTEADFDGVIDVHLKGMFFMAQHVYHGMLARGRGCIINVASQLGIKGGPNIAPYCAAKAGIAGFTRALAWEAAPRGIRVNAIAPGEIDTDILSPGTSQIVENDIPMRRLGTVHEVADLIEFLCSDRASYITGAEIPIDGGQRV